MISTKAPGLYIYKATLVRVVDGDTLILLVDLGFKVYKEITVRLARINAPEMSTLAGKTSKEFLINALKTFNTKITVSSTKLDCYGRSIAEVYVTNNISPDVHNLSDLMVNRIMALYKDYK
jgi:endonuclease YncB( thermonuclease family)